MSRFDDDGEGMPWELWERVVSQALAGRKGQAALADLEAALIALPEPKLIRDHLAADGGVCAVGAYVAHKQAAERKLDVATVIDGLSASVRCWCGHGPYMHGPKCSGKRWGGDDNCNCDEYEAEDDDIYETADAGINAGLSSTLAWHFAYLNDEEWGGATPEQRYERMLAFARRAQGKEVAVSPPGGVSE